MSLNSKELTHPEYRPDIDGLRAIAVLFVVAYHAFPKWFKAGFIGVDIFFVISGFLISTIILGNLERNSFSFIEFYSRRIRRIFPALTLVLIACFAFGWSTLVPSEYKQLGKHIAGGAGFISNFVLWNESGYFDSSANTKPLLHLWSLGIEEQFYIAWPLILWFGWKQRLNLLTLILVIALVSLALNVASIHSDAVYAFYSPQTRFWELLAGAILAYATLHNQDLLFRLKRAIYSWLRYFGHAGALNQDGQALRNVQSLFGLGFIATGVLFIDKYKTFPGWWAVLPTLGALLIIAAGSQSWLNRTILSNRVFVWFGLISYPLYLWHWPILSFMHVLESDSPSREARFIAVLISIVLAWLTYKLIEKPIRFGLHQNIKTFALLFLMSVVGLVGYYSYERDGFESRFPKNVQDLMQYKYDHRAGYRAGSCFLRTEQQYMDFTSCDSFIAGDSKSILIWGDSHAAHLYPGYKAAFGKTHTLLQRTAAGCPPILGIDIKQRPHCKQINDHVFAHIRLVKPDKVVLAARWTRHDWKNLDGTVAKLKMLGIKHIDLVGPVPEWSGTLSKQLYIFYKNDKLHRIPDRMNFGLQHNFIKVDTTLRSFSNTLGINYLSPKEIMCDESGCITKLGETGDTLIAWDYGHLTDKGSQYLVSRFPAN